MSKYVKSSFTGRGPKLAFRSWGLILPFRGRGGRSGAGIGRGWRLGCRIVGGIGLLFVAGWLLLCGYVLLNKQPLLKKARAGLSKQLGGTLLIGDMDASFFRHFPNITLHLSRVVLRDSLWRQHHHDLLQAEDVYVRYALFGSFFSGQARVNKLFLEQGILSFYTDSTGYCNSSALPASHAGRKGQGEAAKGKEAAATNKDAGPPDISVAHMRVLFEKPAKNKLLDLDIRQLDCSIEKNRRSLLLQVSTDMRLNSFVFPAEKVIPEKGIAEKGIYLKNRELSGRFDLRFGTASKILDANQVNLCVDGHAFLFSGRFFTDVSPDPFNLTLESADIPYRQAIGWFPLHAREKLDEYDLDGPVSLKLTIDAALADNPEPIVIARLSGRNKVDIPPGTLDRERRGGLSIAYKGPLYQSYKGPLYQSDSAAAINRENLELDSLAWAPYKKADPPLHLAK